MATITVDVREDIQNGREPLSRILSAVSSLGADGVLELIAPFEPVPLYNVMSKQGFDHRTEQIENSVWKITFFRP